MPTISDFRYVRPSHPGGKALQRLMNYHNITTNMELAEKTGIPLWQVDMIRDGQYDIDERIADKLGIVIGRESANLLLKMQKVVDFYNRHDRRPEMSEIKQMLAPQVFVLPQYRPA